MTPELNNSGSSQVAVASKDAFAFFKGLR